MMDQATFDTIAAMKQQEAHYATTQDIYDDRIVDTQCRTLMVEWCLNVANFCKYSRSTVDIAINCLDRYLAKREDMLDDKRGFQLVAMACFYTAVKIHESVAMSPGMIAQLSKGVYSEEEVESAEADILMTLGWRVNPPTATCFAMNYLKLFPPYSDAVKEVIQRQLDVASKDSFFLGAEVSTIAFAAVINAVEADRSRSDCKAADMAICEALGTEEVPPACCVLKEHFKTAVEFRKLRSRRAVTPPRRPSKQIRSSEEGLSPRCVTMERS
mmetsp:Transcript_10976/g.18196  ORF Transcript_10976/g.18196 Transcript_10976/m.18196 type:complete len:271 (+) Transcript_10976:166-978(+)